MYGLLMLLPQGDAFRTLQARLHSVPTLALLTLGGGGAQPRQQQRPNGADKQQQQQVEGLDCEELLQMFKARQQQLGA